MVTSISYLYTTFLLPPHLDFAKFALSQRVAKIVVAKLAVFRAFRGGMVMSASAASSTIFNAFTANNTQAPRCRLCVR
jgi:hypothetical protein